MDTSSNQLVIAIGKALGGGQASAYNGTVFCQGHNHQKSYSVSVHPRAFMWSAKELPDGRSRTVDPRELIIQTDGVDDPYTLSIERIPFSFPEAVQLSFPLSLPVWGRDLDDYHPVASEVHGTDTTLLLGNSMDPTIFGSFTFDTASGIVRTLFTPTTALKLERELPPENGKRDFGFVAGQGDPDLQNRPRPNEDTH
ncbi:hypothetical protein HAV21_09565 [Paenarthrobacter sp. MSM-2-10-13]|uniref:hypothetical protein n=1 Tax=Paenarthrobacter sp. MSM-2-10-13 TaxID=2717318 RepID=UPI0014235ED6|nr:hypothetical protein [Paenarthrobacter sp. MSM-2-10-13]NHW47136.1 hypothetical protein [Paenarthrobacter sp. MSM-2-10-13]